MMSCIHPGSSINFDGADLQRDEEEEIDREDIKQQQEVCKISYQLMQSQHSDASANVRSLDSPFILDEDDEAPRMQLVKFDHVGNEANHEIDLKYGDDCEVLVQNNGFLLTF